MNIEKILLTTMLIFMNISIPVIAQDEEQKSQNQTQLQRGNGENTQSLEQNEIHGNRFIDQNGDGYRDNAPDLDGDGIPNGRDKDYTGSKNRQGNKHNGFSDFNGDGINDRLTDSNVDGISNRKELRYSNRYDENGLRYKNGKGTKRGNMWGPNDGTGNSGIGPHNGTGHGPGGGSGNCNGTGPKRGGR